MVKYGKTFSAIILASLILLSISLPMAASYADNHTHERKVKRSQKATTHRHKINFTRHGSNFEINTDIFTVRFAGSQQVPKFQFWYNNPNENKTVYQVFFHRLFEFNDTNGNGAYDKTTDIIIPGSMLALPSANQLLKGPENITNDDEVVGVRFNFTLTDKKGKKNLEGVNVTLQCSLYDRNYSLPISGGATYNVTGGAELKIDVIINSWPWKSNESLLCLEWSVTQQDSSIQPSITNNSVTFGRGYFNWTSLATAYGEDGEEIVAVNSSFNMNIGNKVTVYFAYPNFQGKVLMHDPSIGVKPPTVPDIPDIPKSALRFNYSDIMPKKLIQRVLAKKMHVFIFKNLTLVLNASRDLELNVTSGSKVVTRCFSLLLDLNHSIKIDMHITVSPPSGVKTIERSIGFYSIIEPNVTIPIRAQLRLYINETALQMKLHRMVNASRLRWAYWNGTNWVPVDSYIDVEGYLVTNTTHFSTWTVLELMPLKVSGSLSKPVATIGEDVTITTLVKDEDGNSVEGATVKAIIDETTIALSDMGDGNYKGIIETSSLKEGTYNILITARKDGYITDQYLITLRIEATADWTIYGLIAAVITAVGVTASVILLKRK